MAYATREGARIHFWEQGSGSPLVLLMGLGGDSSWWQPQVAPLAARHRVILVDNRGMGASDKPKGPYTTAMMADDAAAVLDAAGVARAQICGLSMGGMIAQELALRHPARVNALILAATYGKPDTGIEHTAERGPGGAGIGALMKGGVPDLGSVDAKQVFKFLMGLVLSPAYLQANKQSLKEMFQRTVESGTTMEHFMAQMHAVMHHDTLARLPSLKTPTLVFTGDSDLLVPPHHSDTLAKLIPGAKLVKLAGGTHGVNLERADEFNQTVLDFFARHPL